jgi:hypothetical protein
MRGRAVSKFCRSAVVIAIVGLVGCFEPPHPTCGFYCGAAGLCPDGYQCAADRQCHAASASSDVTCPMPDGGIIDNVPPMAGALVPAAESNTASINTSVTATFNKPVINVSLATFTLVKAGDVDLISAVVLYDEETRKAILDPDRPLLPSTAYAAMLGPGITDTDGVALQGTISWEFVTAPDRTPPQVTGLEPPANAIAVPIGGTVVATFSEQVSNITSTTFFLADVNGTVPTTIGYVSQTAVSLTPLEALAGNTLYTATLTAGIADFGDNSLAGAPVSWSFTTGADTIPPTIDLRSPEEDATDIPVSTTITIRFTEPVVGVSASTLALDQAGAPVTASVTYTAGTRLARLTPNAALAAGTTYTAALLTGITDVAGNPLPPSSWSFTTAP